MSRFNRTYSNPDLRDDKNSYYRYSHEAGCRKPLFVVGDRVYVDSFRAGSVAYFGELDFSQGDWVGVVLDQPTGNHDGKVHGREYFHCAPYHGILVRPSRVSQMPQQQQRLVDAASLIGRQDSGGIASKYSDHLASGRLSKASSLQTDDSYFYDEDYRAKPANNISGRPRSILGDNQEHHRQPGILKTSARSRSRSISGSPISARLDELASELASSRNSREQQAPVLSFRPKRVEPGESSECHSSGRSSGLSNESSKQASVDLSSEPLKEGDRVLVDSERGQQTGILRYIGQTNFATGEWAGIELDSPNGRNDGSVLSCRYFRCRNNYGLFVPLARVRRFQGSAQRPRATFGDIRNTIKSPPPPPAHGAARASPLGAASQLGRSSQLSSLSSGSSSMSPSLPNSASSSRLSFNDTPNKTTRYFNRDTSNQPRLYHHKSSLFDSFGSNYTFEDLLGDDSALDRDLDRELERSLSRRQDSSRFPVSKLSPFNSNSHNGTRSMNAPAPATKSVKYTFKSCKYDGNPIALKTVEYERH